MPRRAGLYRFGEVMSGVLLLVAAFCLGAGIASSVYSRKIKRQAREQSEYWQRYWHDHYYEIRQTGLTREQMDRMHRLYVDESRANDV